MYDMHVMRRLVATAALAAVAMLYVGPAAASSLGLTGDGGLTRTDQQTAEPGTIPYLSHGIGVDESQFGGQSANVDARHQALLHERDASAAAVGLDPAIETAIQTRLDNAQASGLSGDSPRTRFSAPVEAAPLPHGAQVTFSPSSQPASLGLTGDSAVTRYPEVVPITTASGDNDIEWTSFGAGAGMVALLAAGIAGVLLTTRRRHTVGLS